MEMYKTVGVKTVRVWWVMDGLIMYIIELQV